MVGSNGLARQVLRYSLFWITRAEELCQSTDYPHFLQATRIDCLRIFDVNLRQDFYSREVVERSLEFASVLKLNEDELPTVLQLLDAPSGSHQENIRWLSRTYSLSHVALTRGAAGSMLMPTMCSTNGSRPKSKSSIPLEQATHLPPLLLLGC